MKNEGLLKLCHAFYKMSILEVPPNMLEDLLRAVKYIYSSAVLSHAITLPDSLKKEELIRACNTYASKTLTTRNDIIIYCDLDLEGWKYFTDKFKTNLKYLSEIGALPESVKVVFSFTPHPEKFKGLFYLDKLEMNVFLNKIMISNATEFKRNLDDLGNTIRHELQHFSQQILTSLSESRYLAGLPPRKYLNKEFDPHGRRLDPTNDGGEGPPHELKDIEFHTNVQDAIDIFKQEIVSRKNFGETQKDKINEIHKELAKAWIGLPSTLLDILSKRIEEGNYTEKQKEKYLISTLAYVKPRPPFNVLKKKDQNKWKLAVKIFWKNVSYLF